MPMWNNSYLLAGKGIELFWATKSGAKQEKANEFEARSYEGDGGGEHQWVGHNSAGSRRPPLTDILLA